MNFSEFIKVYKSELISNLGKLKNIDIYRKENRNIKLLETSVSKKGSPSGLTFISSSQETFDVNLMLQNIGNQAEYVGIRFALPLLPDGKKEGCASALKLFDWNQDDNTQINWKEGRQILSWGTKESFFKFQRHIKLLYGPSGVLIRVGGYTDYAVEERGESLLISNEKIKDLDDTLLLNNEDDENNVKIQKGIEQIAEIHAKAITLKALDLILYQLNSAKNEFLIRRKNECISSKEISDFPFITTNTAAQNTIPFLSSSTLKAECETNNLYFSDELYQAISTSINSGRHIIFTGPPGCGKSQLAEQVGTVVAKKFNAKTGSNAKPKIVTASPSWTSGEVIGRYFPSRNNGAPLEFHPGVFLEAVKEKRCLVIDEINRANMDECFGELFTVLAGQECDLLYKDAIEGSEGEDGILKYGPIKIIPANQADSNESSEYPGYCIYAIDEGFRLIGTMNTFDRSALHQMSFALMRRFDVISVSAPSAANINKIINTKIAILAGENNQKLPSWGAPAHRNAKRNSLRSQIIELTKNLFSSKNGLVTLQVVGTSMIKDFLDFVVFTLNPTSEMRNRNIRIANTGLGNGDNAVIGIIRSVLALALVVKLIPQLASAEEHIPEIIQKIRSLLSEGDDDSPRVNFLVTENEDDITLTSANTKCFEFFAEELRLAYAHTHLNQEINAALANANA